MTAMQYSIVGTEDGANITVFVPGQSPLVAHSSHPNFDTIVKGVLADDPSVVDLFDMAKTVATRFDKLSERVSAAHGRLYFDGEEVNNTLSTQVVRFLNEGVKNWKPLVLFFENVQQNPNEHSREQLYTWLNDRDFTITEDGMIVGYKGVRPTADGGFESINRGKAIVDGQVHTGAIPNHAGAVVEMPRNEVTHNPADGCSTGLHVGTYEYANSFAQGALLEVHVNPRDVVSVPTDCDWQKMRVCRYTVVDTIDAPYTSPARWNEDEYGDEDWGWGEEDDGNECYHCGLYPSECDCQ